MKLFYCPPKASALLLGAETGILSGSGENMNPKPLGTPFPQEFFNSEESLM